MNLRDEFRKVVVQCVPDRMRIWRKKQIKKDVIWDGNWLI